MQLARVVEQDTVMALFMPLSRPSLCLMTEDTATAGMRQGLAKSTQEVTGTSTLPHAPV